MIFLYKIKLSQTSTKLCFLCKSDEILFWKWDRDFFSLPSFCFQDHRVSTRLKPAWIFQSWSPANGRTVPTGANISNFICCGTVSYRRSREPSAKLPWWALYKLYLSACRLWSCENWRHNCSTSSLQCCTSRTSSQHPSLRGHQWLHGYEYSLHALLLFTIWYRRCNEVKRMQKCQKYWKCLRGHTAFCRGQEMGIHNIHRIRTGGFIYRYRNHDL